MHSLAATDSDLIRLLRTAVEHMREAVIITDQVINPPGPHILYVNEAFTRLTGYTPGEVMGKTPRILQGSATDRAVLERLRRCMEAGIDFEGEAINYRKDGSPYFLEWRMAPLRNSEGVITHWVAIQQDITDRKRLEREVMEASVREQQRLGRDLHDGLGQHLTAIALLSRALAQHLAPADAVAAADAAQLSTLAEDALDQTRSLAHMLFPPDVVAHGLMLALEDLARNTQARMACTFTYDVPVLLHNPVVATNVYQIAQEAINNAIKHSGGSRVTLRLTSDADRTTLTIDDDGTGIGQAALLDGQRPGMGLRIMGYRAQAISAHLRIEPRAEGGTRVSLLFDNDNADAA